MDLKSTVTLNDGILMPLFGLGTSGGTSKFQDPENAVVVSLQNGYRLIDTAERYGTEKQIGFGLKRSEIARNEVFLVTKTFYSGRKMCLNAFENSLKDLGVDYVDLYLIHSPLFDNILETYDTILELKQARKIRSVGVSNFGIHHLDALVKAGRPLPAVNQIELHPWLRQEDIVNYCRDQKIAVMGYSPIAKAQKLDDPVLAGISKGYNKTPAQVLIRWSLQRGYITIPKSSQSSRIKENANVFDFNISDSDMETLSNFPEFSCRLWPVDPTKHPFKS